LGSITGSGNTTVIDINRNHIYIPFRANKKVIIIPSQLACKNTCDIRETLWKDAKPSMHKKD
jgi:hypothetical protein